MVVFHQVNSMFFFQINDIGHLSEARLYKAFAYPRVSEFFEEREKVCAFSYFIICSLLSLPKYRLGIALDFHFFLQV